MTRTMKQIIPAEKMVTITASDSADLATPGVYLTCLVSGDAVVQDMSGDEFTIYLNAGIVFPCKIKRVLTTGTTATGLVGLVP